jgi:hypothetical protein
MSSRSTRNKIRFQGKSALDDLRHASDHLTELAALADEASTYINDNLPVIIVALESVRVTLKRFYEGL